MGGWMGESSLDVPLLIVRIHYHIDIDRWNEEENEDAMRSE